MTRPAPGGCPSNHGGCGERSGGARRQPRCQMAARSSLLRRPTPGARPARRTSSVVAALAALAPRLVRLARHDHPDGLLGGSEQAVARPLIGISSYGRAGQRQTFSLPCEYGDIVRLAGGVPIVLPAVEGEIPEALGAIAALILPGGGDVDPAHYGGVRHEANYGISPERDGFQLALARAALARPDLPILCICRGMQLVNIALGGDLVSHIPDHFGEKVRHRHPELRPVEHPGNIEPASRLARILGATELSVHSVHHQAVGRLGEGPRAGAWSPDGVIEAVESDRHPFLIGVQWHPELGALGDERQRRLFEALVRHPRGGRAPPPRPTAPRAELTSPPAPHRRALAARAG